jgi:hypothetical protein
LLTFISGYVKSWMHTHVFQFSNKMIMSDKNE